ncbi:MAG TPA: zinc ribbon domain-containing protein [Terriglobales bacterium]|nr:zinc ribbon domain-containing protein [Terriglobales bacterium]
MAFCTSCGKQLDATARFCDRCGAAVGAAPQAAASSGAAVQPAPAAAPVPQSGGSSGLKIALIVFAVLVALALVGTASVAIIGLRIARATRIHASGDDATVQTPFGEVKSTHDAAQVARDLGVDVYPGARPLEGAGVVNLPGLHVGGANFESSDSLDKVAEFYRRQFPKAAIDVAERDHQTFVVTASSGMVTIDLRRAGDGTEIHLASMGAKPGDREPQ